MTAAIAVFLGVATYISAGVRFAGTYKSPTVSGALASSGRQLLVMDESKVEDDLVRDVTEVLTSLCARLYGRRGARNRAKKALAAAGCGK